MTYMVLPHSDTQSWLLAAGITLVCLPWLFWFLTFVYRVISRVCGLRVGIGKTGVGGDGVDDTRENSNNNNVVDDENIAPVDPAPVGSMGNGPTQAQYQGVAAAMAGSNQDGHDHGRKGGKHSRSSSNSSTVSHESEMPLALSMAS